MLENLTTQFGIFLRSRGLKPEYDAIDENLTIVRASVPGGMIQCHIDKKMPLCRRIDRTFYDTMLPEDALAEAAESITTSAHCIKAWAMDDSVNLCFETMLASPTDVASPQELGEIIDLIEHLWASKIHKIHTRRFIKDMENAFRERERDNAA